MDRRFQVQYYDGLEPRGRPVECVVDSPDHFSLIARNDGQFVLEGTLSSLRFLAPSVPSAERIILPDGGYLEADPEIAAALAEIAPHRPGRLSRMLLRLERHRGFVLTSSAAFLAFLVLFFTVLLPAGSEWLAHRVPIAITEKIGAKTLPLLQDRFLFHGSRLDEETRAELRDAFQEMVDSMDSEHSYRLHFFNSPMLGANAFALPSGDIVLLDDLVDLAEAPDEILAVLAHEIGHVEHRHGLQMVINNSVLVFMFTLVTGDFGSLTGAAASLPAILVESGYSRRFEFEADAFARELMIERGIELEHFAQILQRLTGYDSGSTVLDHISTHPPTAERVKRVLED